MAKKDPFKYTIGLDASDSNHIYVANLLNDTKKKGKLIVEAVLAYTGKKESEVLTINNIETEVVGPAVQEIIWEEVRKVLEAYENSKEDVENMKEINLMNEEPLEMDSAIAKDISDAIIAFRKQ